MKKKIGIIIMILIEILCLCGVYLIRGEIGPWVWSFCVFISAPLACIALMVQLIIGIVRIYKRKNLKWNALYLVTTMIMAYPITILFGISLLTYPTKGNEEAIEVISPVKDAVLLGGKEYKTHAVWPSECYAWDILKKPYAINSKELSDYGIYLADVVCPVNGTIIEIKDDEENILPNTEEFKSSLGNYIFIKVEETGNYLILAHLEKDSINVSVGEYMEQGEIIAKVGNSGTTSEPHLHMQYQKNNPAEMKFPTCQRGLPMKLMGS